MKKKIIKRVGLVGPLGERMYYTHDFIGTLSDECILSVFDEAGKTVWIGDNLYKIQHEGETIRHYRFEVYSVTQYTKSWFDLLLDAIRRI